MPKRSFHAKPPAPQKSTFGSIAPNRSANMSESKCVQCSEPRPASMKVNSGRFERSASSSVITTGTTMMTTPAMPPAMSGLMLERSRVCQPAPHQCAKTKPAST